MPVVKLECFVERPGISKTIASVLQPPSGYNSYDMIIGYHGTGKTTLVRHLGHQHPGIIYVDIAPGATSEERFAESFGQAIQWSTPRRHWIAAILDKIGVTREETHGKHLLLYST